MVLKQRRQQIPNITSSLVRNKVRGPKVYERPYVKILRTRKDGQVMEIIGSYTEKLPYVADFPLRR